MVVQILAAIAFGGAVGLPLALMGSGGSILAVPILVYGFGRDVPTAAGTSLAIVGAIALTGAVGHFRAGRVLLLTGLLFGATGALGAALGARLNALTPGPVVLFLFALVMIVTASGMLRSSRRAAPSAREFREPHDLPSLARLLAAGLAVGALSGFFGVGGGFLIIPALMLVIRAPIHLAVGTSLFAIALQSAGGLIGYVQLGKVDFALAGLVLAGGALGTLAGMHLAGRLSGARLQQVFASFVIVVALFLVYRNGVVLIGGL
jgi:uncharacterized membrane protein YfcA